MLKDSKHVNDEHKEYMEGSNKSKTTTCYKVVQVVLSICLRSCDTTQLINKLKWDLLLPTNPISQIIM